ncbi:hypothetical protein EJB05_27506, partial [Eragrostis curvula]
MGGGEDRISALPEELLHCILVRLGSARAAARTSVLSRRWRPVWTSLPEILLDGDEAPRPAPSFLDAVDAALGVYSAPTLERLRISVPDTGGLRVPPHRLEQWLRFASLRVVDTLIIVVPARIPSFLNPELDGEEAAELELPSCGAAKTIALSLGGPWRIRLAGVFSALTRLDVHMARMEGSELTALVCTRCPQLRVLILCITLVAVSDVFICSDLLNTLHLLVGNTRRLEIVAPKLEVLTVAMATEVHVCAPKLAEIALIWWPGETYDPHRHHFTNVGQRLRLLDIRQESTAVSLTHHFVEVTDLRLLISIANGIGGYERFLNETNKLPKSETLRIILLWNHHGLVPSMMHLLRRCSSTRKLSVQLSNTCDPSLRFSCPSSCPCRLAYSHEIDDIALNSLEVVEISSWASSPEELEFVEQLSRCKAAVLKRLVIKDTNSPATLTKTICEMIRSICRPDLEIEFLISVPDTGGLFVPPHRLVRWLQFASQRAVGALILHVPARILSFDGEGETELEIPPCGAAKTIVLKLGGPLRIRLAGVFSALTRLEISMARMEGSELTALVRTQCPLLKELLLCIGLIARSDVSICSNSLHTLQLFIKKVRRLEIVAPKLDELWMSLATEVHVSAPKLAVIVLYWRRGKTYDPRRHQFANVGRRLRVLDISQ